DLTDVKFLDAREGWAVGDGGTIIHTSDGGRTWRHERSGTRHRLERLSFPAPARGFAVGFGGTIVAYTRAAQEAPRLKASGGR
ncbi:MAG TPA: YCF48-related protein, partial [Pyrinomonadaceae bacterium]|nr:YCF48-related protein [Pyrinomonadaceae bacterium]